MKKTLASARNLKRMIASAAKPKSYQESVDLANLVRPPEKGRRA
jgi:hypothetical protein